MSCFDRRYGEACTAGRAAPRRRGAGALLALGVLLGLPGCGFHPLYGKAHETLLPQLEAVKIDPIADRPGQQLRNLLAKRINPRGAPARPRYLLETSLTFSKQSLSIEKTEVVTRSRLTANATFSLRALDSNQTVFRGTSRAATSFDEVGSQYANVVAEEDAKLRTLAVISDDMATQLSLFFARPAQPAAGAPSQPQPAPAPAAPASPEAKY